MTREEQTALKTVINFLSNYLKRNVEGCVAAITKSKPIMVLGTNDNEVFKTIPEISVAFKRDFKNMSNIRWGKRRNFHVKVDPTLASVIIELPVSYQSEWEKVKTLFRYALVLTKEGEKWKICSGMAAVPFATGTYSF
jgi:hypothetical protein